MTEKSLKTFKEFVARRLCLPPSVIERRYREARQVGLIKTGARGVNAHMPTDEERRLLLLHIAKRALGVTPWIPATWNDPSEFRVAGVRVEQLGGVRKVAEISIPHARAIIDFGCE